MSTLVDLIASNVARPPAVSGPMMQVYVLHAVLACSAPANTEVRLTASAIKCYIGVQVEDACVPHPMTIVINITVLVRPSRMHARFGGLFRAISARFSGEQCLLQTCRNRLYLPSTNWR